MQKLLTQQTEKHKVVVQIANYTLQSGNTFPFDFVLNECSYNTEGVSIADYKGKVQTS